MAEPKTEIHGVECTEEEVVGLYEWWNSPKGNLFWAILNRAKDDAHAHAAMPTGRMYQSGSGAGQYVPMDVHNAMVLQELAQENAYDNITTALRREVTAVAKGILSARSQPPE